MMTPGNIDELAGMVRQLPHVLIAGGGSKPPLSGGANVSLAGMRGILQYDPQEFTITVLAGTPLAEVEAALDEHGQFLPFDPPLSDQGATIGGTVAAGLSGPASFKYGGVRDFLIGVRFVTGVGEIVFGGGKVVKNAAGFDFPKLMVGALGEFGLCVEFTLKVFPRPQQTATLCLRCASREQAIRQMKRVAISPLDAVCLDITSEHQLLVRLGGRPDAMAQRIQRCQDFLEGSVEQVDEGFWASAARFDWVPTGATLLRVGAELDALLDVIDGSGVSHYRISGGGQTLWLAWPASNSLTELETTLQQASCTALSVRGDQVPARLGAHGANPLAARIRAAVDPQNVLQREPSTALRP